MSTTVLTVLTLLIAIIAAAPGFLSLNKEQAKIYYSISKSGIQVPDSMNTEGVRKILSDNGIPSDTLSISIINQGNAEADAVKVSVKTAGNIIAASSNPKVDENTIWVDIPKIDIENKPNNVQFSIKNLGITKIITFDFGFQRDQTSKSDIQVFYNGIPAQLVQNVSTVTPWSTWHVFKIPGLILAGGTIFVLLWAIGIVIFNNPELRKGISEFLIKVATEMTNGIFPFIR